jgi:hypothetical protein
VTLISLHVEHDRATLLTDSLTYGPGLCDFTTSSKTLLLPHIDAAVTGKGPRELGTYWEATIGLNVVRSLEEMGDLAREELPACWEQTADRTGSRAVGEIYHVGWSQQQGRFRAFEYSSEDGFQGRELTDSSPFLSNPPAVDPLPPSTDTEWLHHGQVQYEHYALATVWSGRKTMIGGELVLTRLERGAATQHRLYTFPTDDWRFRKMMIGAMTFEGQAGPCYCGSGLPQARCHLPTALTPEAPCCCQSGKAFGACHRVDPEGRPATAHWIRHQDEYRDTQMELATDLADGIRRRERSHDA